MSMPNVCPYCGGHIRAKLAECPFCRKKLVERIEGALPEGTMLQGRYTLESALYRDGEGIVYDASDIDRREKVRIKEFFPASLCGARTENGRLEPKPGCEVTFKTSRMDFEDLYSTLKRVTPSAGLTPVLELLKANNTAYGVTEPPTGHSLAWYLHHNRKLMRPAEVRSLLQPVMEGAAALHKAGLVHRGISPDNIFITRGGTASLYGYGTMALRVMDSELEAEIYDGYTAPEQYASSEFEGRYTDVYALAAVAYRLVTGQVPLSARQRKVRDGLESALEYNDTLPEYFSRVLESGMKISPKARIQNVPELMSALASKAAANSLLGANAKKDDQISTRTILMGAMSIILVLLLLLCWCMVRIAKPPEISVPSSSEASSAVEIVPEVRIMPNFVGLYYRDVLYNPDNLERYHFSITEVFSSDVAEGVVMNQEPSQGSVLGDEAATVQLIISKGPNMVTMPRIIGFTQENAVTLLNSKGINFSLLMLANNGEYAAGCVARTDMAEGTEFDAGKTVVNVYIAAERDNTVAPAYEEIAPPAAPEATAVPEVEP